MEQKIENMIDNRLESIASLFYFFSIGFGVLLFIVGIIIFLNDKRSKEKKGKINTGLICVIIGIVAILSGLAQYLR